MMKRLDGYEGYEAVELAIVLYTPAHYTYIYTRSCFFILVDAFIHMTKKPVSRTQ